MPLYRGEDSVDINSRKLMDEGYSKKKATAIAVRIANRKKRGKKRKEKKHHG